MDKTFKKRFLSINDFKQSLVDQHINRTSNVIQNNLRTYKQKENSHGSSILAQTMNQNSIILYNNHNDEINTQTLPSLAATNEFKVKNLNLKDNLNQNYNKKSMRSTINTITKENFEDEMNNLASFYHMSEHQMTSGNFHNNNNN